MGITQCFLVLVITPLIVVSQQQVLDPCGEWKTQGLRCEFGQECRLIQSYCFAQPCPPKPKCVPKRPRVSSCRYGDPVLDTNYRPLSCYPGSDCPHHTTCNTEVMDTQTTCCWTPRATATQPPGPSPRPLNPPPQPSDPCAVTFCLPQQTCEVRPPSNCFFGPCTPIGVCVDKPPPPPQPTQGPCAGVLCPIGFQCEVKPSQCFSPGPCSHQGVCVSNRASKTGHPPLNTGNPTSNTGNPPGPPPYNTGNPPFNNDPLSFNTGYHPFNNGPLPYNNENIPFHNGPHPYNTGNPPFNTGYPQFNIGYPTSNNGYPPFNNGYPPSNNGYPPSNNGNPPFNIGNPPSNTGNPTSNTGNPPFNTGNPTSTNGYPPSSNGYPTSNAGKPTSNTGNPITNNGYPPSNNGYPPSNTGNPTANNGYPPSNNGYPPSNNGYPPSNTGNPTSNTGNPTANNGYPPSNNGYPPSNTGNPTSNTGNPTANNGYPASNNGYPPSNNGYPPSNTGNPLSNTGKSPFSTGNPTLNSGRPGLCPANVTGGCDINCEMDLDCDGKMKCCKHSCGSLCVSPVVTPPPSLPNTPTPTHMTSTSDYPCSTKKCSLGMECRLHQVFCFRSPCPLLPTCVPETPKSSPQRCPIGEPVLDINNKEFFCGRGPGRSVCPDSTYCNIHPSDFFAVCCHKSNTFSPNTTSAPVPTSCAYMTCRRDEVCREEAPVCVRSLCPGPRAVCRSITKAGTCPREMPPPFGRCTTECSMDGDCPGHQKCCGQCRRQCTDPLGPVPSIGPIGPIAPIGKPGTCHTVPPGVFGICKSKCFADSECPGSQKCCGNCPRECTNPVQPVTNPQPPSKPVVKVGSCPSAAGLRGTCMEECSGDANCPGTQKCCSNGCGRSCQEPTVFYADSDPCKRQTCYRNQVCRLQQGICFQPPCKLVTKCVYKTSADTPGACKSGYPVTDYGQRPLYCNPYSPNPCPDRTVCSNNVCCWDTNTGAFPTQRPGRCPNVHGFTSWFHCSFSKGCNGDNHCDPNTKCCDSGSCGKRCMIPLR